MWRPLEWNFFTAFALSSVIGCSEAPPDPPREEAGAAPVMAHGDHDPRYGGTVWMHGDLHFEVVLDPEGRHRVYFSDATRIELPAAVASGVRITIERSEREPEALALAIDEFGESWVASGQPVHDPDARALVSFVYEEEPYQIEIPFVAAPPDPNAPDPHAYP